MISNSTMTNDYKEFLEDFPFLTLARCGNNEYVGIVQNVDNNVISIYVYELIKDTELRKKFLQLGDEWWMETNRQIPINIIMGARFTPFRESLLSFTNKDFEILYGPSVCLRNIMTKRVKRKNIQLIRKQN